MTAASLGANIDRALSLNTNHLPEHLGSAGLDRIEGLAAESIEGGWFIYVPSGSDEWWERETADLPAEVRAVLDYARKRACRYIVMHCDESFVDDLPRWEW